MLCAKTCDRCGRHAKTVVDDIEFNEFLSVNHLAGYGSIFGDSNRLKLDYANIAWKTSWASGLRSVTNDAPVTPVPTILTIGAHNVYYVKLPVKILYFTIHIHTQINQYVVISDFPPVSVEKFNLCFSDGTP